MTWLDLNNFVRLREILLVQHVEATGLWYVSLARICIEVHIICFRQHDSDLLDMNSLNCMNNDDPKFQELF